MRVNTWAETDKFGVNVPELGLTVTIFRNVQAGYDKPIVGIESSKAEEDYPLAVFVDGCIIVNRP